MTVRTFAMPKSLNESLANSQPPVSDAGRASPKSTHQSYPSSQKEPLANHGVKEKPGITFAAQDTLAKLPIPELESTLKKYRNVLKPLQSGREQANTASVVEDFLKGEGLELQARLQKYATGKTSYIEQFCKMVTNQIASLKDQILTVSPRVRLLSKFRQSCGTESEPILLTRR